MNRRFSSWICRAGVGLFLAVLCWSPGGLKAQDSFAETGEARQSLDGPWRFTTDPAQAEQSESSWDTLNVPGNWDTKEAYSTYTGKGWYRRSFTVPRDWRGRHLRLKFDAVYHEAHVFLNGKELGSHLGGYTPFEFDVTGKVFFDKANTLTVCADNSYQRGAWWPWGGISRSVTLISNGDIRLVWQHVQCEPDLSGGTARLLVTYKIANESDQPRTVTVHSTLEGLAHPALSQTVKIAPRSQATCSAGATLAKQDVRLWDFDHPNVYRLSTQVSTGMVLMHAEGCRFGIRKVEVRPEGIWLNGEQVRLVGFNRVSDSREFGNTEPDELVRKDVDLMKRCGATMARLMHTPQAPNLLDYLDDKGMLIFAEIPVWGSGDPQIQKDNPLTKQWLAEMINRDYNHPCIIGWSPGNELAGHYDYVKSMLDYIRAELDSTRLLAYVSNTGAKRDANPQNDPITFNDIALMNSYGGFDRVAQTVHERWPNKPIFFSEWGRSQIGAQLSATIPKFEEGWEQTVKDHPYVAGLSIWTFNDYRSGYKNTPASGNREWGVVDIHRQPKAAYQQVRNAFAPVRSLSVSNGKIRIEPRSYDEIPAYVLRGYCLEWKSPSTSSGTSKTGSISLPEIRPGSPALEIDLPPEAEGATIGLKTPTGYIVKEATKIVEP